MAATIKDISKHTGLSLGTVSKYLNGIPIKEKNRLLIDKAIDDLDYNLNHAARSLRTKKTNVIGFIIPSLELTFSIKLLTVIEKELAEQGYTVTVCVVKGINQKEDEGKLSNLLQQRIDGLIVLPPAHNRHLQEWIKKISKTTPTIILDRILKKNRDCQHITINNEAASYLATNYLVEMGHTEIGIILGDKGGYTSEERLKGFTRTLTENGIAINSNYIYYGNFKRSLGYSKFQEMMESPTPPSAIFVTNYDMTLGALEYITEKNLRVGKDVSIIGFDLDELTKLFSPRLAMVIQPVEEMGEYVTKNILELVKDNGGSESDLEFSCHIDWGGSVGKRE